MAITGRLESISFGDTELTFNPSETTSSEFIQDDIITTTHTIKMTVKESEVCIPSEPYISGLYITSSERVKKRRKSAGIKNKKRPNKTSRKHRQRGIKAAVSIKMLAAVSSIKSVDGKTEVTFKGIKE